jgi:hypothetical protein
MAIPGGWTELTKSIGDLIALGNALDLLQRSYPDDQYLNLDVGKLRRKMVLRPVVMEDGETPEQVMCLRVFHRGVGTTDNYMAAFFFARHRPGEKKKRAYCLSLGVEAGVMKTTITTATKDICGYMKNQPGGRRLVILDKVGSWPPPQPPTSHPATARPYLTAALDEAIAAGKITYKFAIEADPRPWPYHCYVWRINI